MEIVLRITLIYIVFMIGFRVLGKRELSQLSPFDLVTLLIIPEIVSQALIGQDYSMAGGLIGVSTLFCLVFLNSLLSYMSKTFRKVSESPPTMLVANGRLIEEHLHLERIPPDEIYGEMHKVGLSELSQVRWALLEGDGKLSFIPMDPPQVKRAEESGVE